MTDTTLGTLNPLCMCAPPWCCPTPLRYRNSKVKHKKERASSVGWNPRDGRRTSNSFLPLATSISQVNDDHQSVPGEDALRIKETFKFKFKLEFKR